MTIDEAIKCTEKLAKEYKLDAEISITKYAKENLNRLADEYEQLASWLKELKEAKRLVTRLKAKLCDSSEYCAYCDELDMSEHNHFTCKYKKKKIPVVCYWQVLTPAHFDDIPWTKNEV